MPWRRVYEMTGDGGVLVRMALLLSPVAESEEAMIQERQDLIAEVRDTSRYKIVIMLYEWALRMCCQLDVRSYNVNSTRRTSLHAVPSTPRGLVPGKLHIARLRSSNNIRTQHAPCISYSKAFCLYANL